MNKASKYTLYTLLVTDVLLILLHSVLGWDVFNLDQEANLPTWYSSAKLLGLALISALIWNAERQGSAPLKFMWLWLVVALVFLGLSADETASFHERMARFIMQESAVGLDIRETVLQGDQHKDSFAWVLLFSPLIVATALFFLFFFFNRLKHCRPALLAAMIGLALYILAIGLEATIYLLPSIKDWSSSHVRLYNSLITIEESAEFLGSTAFVTAFFFYLQRVSAQVKRALAA